MDRWNDTWLGVQLAQVYGYDISALEAADPNDVIAGWLRDKNVRRTSKSPKELVDRLVRTLTSSPQLFRPLGGLQHPEHAAIFATTMAPFMLSKTPQQEWDTKGRPMIQSMIDVSESRATDAESWNMLLHDLGSQLSVSFAMISVPSEKVPEVGEDLQDQVDKLVRDLKQAEIKVDTANVRAGGVFGGIGDAISDIDELDISDDFDVADLVEDLARIRANLYDLIPVDER